MDRISKRVGALAADFGKVSTTLNSFNETIPKVYPLETGDLPAIRTGLRSSSKYISSSQALFHDESQSVDVGLLEDLKQIRDTFASVIELFERYEYLGGNDIPQLERRIAANEQRLQQASTRPETKPAELQRIRLAISKDQNSIKLQTNRSWLIKECISEELVLCQRSQYQMSRLLREWSVENVKYAELHAENWTAMNNEVSDLPII